MVNSRNWKDLIVWQKSHELVLELYKVLRTFPSEEKFAIVDQMKRAAYSIPSNIVEGHSKNSKKEFVRYLYISRGSLEEVKYFLLLSKDLHYINQDRFNNLSNKLSEIGFLLNQLIKSLKTSTPSIPFTTSTTSKTSNRRITPNEQK